MTKEIMDDARKIGKVNSVAEAMIPMPGAGLSGEIKGTTSIFSYITPKITKQMISRGWTTETVQVLVNEPWAVRTAVNKATGNMAQAYFAKDGTYVVKDIVTNEIIQISNRNDVNWIPDATIFNPYRP